MRDISNYSNVSLAQKKATKYIGKKIYLSTHKDKKYMVQNPSGKWDHFGAMGYEDNTKHQDDNRRQRYLARATKIKGNWKEDKYSPNNLSIHILW
jgi:hypothetical protein